MTDAVKSQRPPGRPSTGAKERILDAGLETLLEEGYAGLTYTKVANRAGENKSLISYYFDSKQGLVGAVAELVGERITGEILEEIREAKQVTELAAGLISGLWKVMDDDHRIARLYFDLSAVSVVDDQVGIALGEVKDRWRLVIARYLTEAGVAGSEIESASVYLMAGVEGLAIERLDGGESARLESARAMFVRGASFAISGEGG